MKTRLSPGALLFSLGLAVAGGAEVPVWTKLDTWIVPKVEMENLPLGEALAWVRAKSREIDPGGATGENAGVRLGFERTGGAEPERLVTLQAENIALGDLLDEIGRATKRSVQIFEDGVVLLKDTRPAPDNGMVTRTFRVPPGFGSADDGVVGDASDDPFDEDRKSPPRTTGSAEARAFLEEAGIAFPEGSAVIYSEEGSGGALTIRTTPSQMELIDEFFTPLGGPGSGPKQCSIQAEVYALDPAQALALVREFEGKSDAERLVRKFATLCASGEAELVAQPMIVTRSGQRAKVENGWRRELVTGYTVEDGKDRATSEEASAGVTLEVDPVFNPDGRTIDLNIALDVGTGEPTVTRNEILAPVSGQKVTVESADIHAARAQTAITVMSGQPQLLGVFPARPGSDQAMLVIVTATIRHVRDGFPVPE